MEESLTIVTKIEEQKKNKNRCNVYINGEFSFACSKEIVYKYKLKENCAVKIADIKHALVENNYLNCKETALNIIERSYKSEKEIRDKLQSKGYDIKSIDKSIEFLKSYNYVDDERYAELYIKEKMKTQGKNKIKYSLIKKGLPEELIKSKLEVIGYNNQYDTAKALADKKYSLLIKEENDIRKIYKKLGDTLIRNGFDSEIVNEILDKVVCKEDIIPQNSILQNETDIKDIALKRYNIIIKSEKDEIKIYKKLMDYLLRRGFLYEDIKIIIKDLVNNGGVNV